MADKYIRLAPFNPRRGYKAISYTYKSQKFIGGERPNWYIVDQSLANELEPLSQVHDDPASPPLFEIYTKEQKEQVEGLENNRYLAALGAIRETISIARDLQTPITNDIRSEDIRQNREPVSEAVAGGRASALPPPRRQTRGRNERGFVAAPTSPDASDEVKGESPDSE